jgi:hypothetical protein
MTEQNEKTEIIQEVKQEAPMMIGSMVRRKGLKLYVFNTVNSSLGVAKTELISGNKERIFAKPEERYLWALNIENAKRKLRKYGYSL